MKGGSSTTDAHQLFDIVLDITKLYQTNTYIFNHFVAQILYLSNRARWYIQLAVSFLCTILIEPDTDDHMYLARMKNYIQVTISLPLILSKDKYRNIKWYVDAAFAVHNDTQSHTGWFMTMKKWGAYVYSIKQILSTNISTEANIVGVNDFLTQEIRAWYFLKEKGYEINENVIYQDNESVIRLEKNSIQSSSKWKIHINIRFYLITDRITKNETSM